MINDPDGGYSLKSLLARHAASVDRYCKYLG